MKAKPALSPQEFINAVKRNRLTLITQMVAQQPEIANQVGGRNQHPLMVAAYLNRPNIIKVLLDSGTIPDPRALRDENGYTVLEKAGFGFCHLIRGKSKSAYSRLFKAYCSTLSLLGEKGCQAKASGH